MPNVPPAAVMAKLPTKTQAKDGATARRIR